MPPARSALAVAVVAVTGATVTLAGCSGDDTSERGGRDPAAGTTVADAAEPFPPGRGGPGTDGPADSEFLALIFADDEVTAGELADGYEAYVRCLADGGGYGRYAYDVDLHAVLTLDWRVPGDDEAGTRATALDRDCSRRYLAGLDGAYFGSHPDRAGLSARQRASIASCVEPISPEVAAAIPDEITVDTAGGGLYIGDPQFDAAFLGADTNQTEAIGLCFSTIGAPWHDFGDPPDVPESTA